MVLEMRRRGVRIDVAAAERARDQLLQKRDAAFAEMSEKLGMRVGMDEIGRNKWLAETFDAQASIIRARRRAIRRSPAVDGWMHKHPHWLPQLIVKADKYNNAGGQVPRELHPRPRR